jgi:zinc and cadmium transporter
MIWRRAPCARADRSRFWVQLNAIPRAAGEMTSIDNATWIINGGLLMSAIAWVGGLTSFLKPETLDRLLLPFVSLAAGTLFGGAFSHTIPEGTASLGSRAAAIWLVSGFTTFLALEQFLHWHQSHRVSAEGRKPVTVLILIGDAIHNFIGGLGVASTFLIAWIAAAAHEVPQELGDFGILAHGGFPAVRPCSGTWSPP